MLLNDLYTIQSLTETPDRIICAVMLNKDHDIFKGHFPGQPVLPGVCMMEMIAEIAGKAIGKTFRISGGPQLKFLHMIDPGKNPVINLDIHLKPVNDILSSSGRIYFGSEIFMKFQLSFIANPAE